jgi:aminopeptidase N
MRRSVVFFVLTLALLAAAEGQRLPGGVLPVHYQITLEPIFADNTFHGEETIDVQVLAPTASITLNAAEINFGEVTVTSGGKTQPAKVAADPQKEMATLTVAEALAAGPASLHIRFTGALNDKLRGFYLSTTKRRKYAVTQFEATDARRAFPCFDEPALKATFEITAIVDNGDTAISNGKIVADTPGPVAGKHTLKFATTPKMSSYLAALAVGDFQCLEGSADGVPIRVCAVPEKKELGKVGLDAAEHILKFYDQYFGIPYPFEKLDLVALPDFAYGAMENTGAMFFQEDALLAEENASVEARLEVAGGISHELAHQWFGDLVTMRWWDDIWLNEGFATWISIKPLKAWKPETDTDTLVAQAASATISGDSLKSARAIHAAKSEAETPAQIAALFDDTTYGKSAVVLTMLEASVGEERFRQGVNAYLKKHAYGNAAAADFWSDMAEATGTPIDRIMPSFVTQAGAPMLTVSARCEGNKTMVQLAQRRFFIDPELLKAASPELWQIPVCMKTGGEAGNSKPQCQVLSAKEQTVTLEGCAAWLFANAGARGYYRVAYSPELLHSLGAHLQELTPAERILLLGDEMGMVRAQQLPISEYLTLVEGLRGERNRRVLGTVAGPLSFIADRIVSDAGRPRYQAWLGGLFRPIAQELGWKSAPGESDERRLLRPRVIEILGSKAHDPQVLAKASELARQYLDDPGAVDPDLVPVVLNLAASQGDAALYDQFLQRAKAAKSPAEYDNFMTALTRFPSPALATRTLESTLTPEMKVQDLGGIFAGELQNPKARELTWQFLQAHYSVLSDKLAGSLGVKGLGWTASFFCDARMRDEEQKFTASHPTPGSEREDAKGVEQLNACIAFRGAQQASLDAWLEKH